MSAKDYSLSTGFPLALIRRLCREGTLPHWKNGRVYLLDEAQATDIMNRLREEKRPPARAVRAGGNMIAEMRKTAREFYRGCEENAETN